jgi:CspA family cold shock protein
VAPREQRSSRGKANDMATGTIRTLRDRGFGFIEPDGDAGSGELFFHHSAVSDRGFEMLQVGQRVRFDVTPDPRDPSRQRAINVVPEDDSGE